MPKMISLRSSDGETFEIEEVVAAESLTLKKMIEDGCADDTIPLPNVSSRILTKVVEYCRKHAEAKASFGAEDDEEWIDNIVLSDEEFAKVYDGDVVHMEVVADLIKEKAPEHVKDLNRFDADFVQTADMETLLDLMEVSADQIGGDTANPRSLPKPSLKADQSTVSSLGTKAGLL